MLLLPTKVNVLPHPHGTAVRPALLGEEQPVSHQGSGNLALVGARKIVFDVMYDIILVQVREAAEGTTSLHGTVRCMKRRDGRALPPGVYSLKGLPACRLAHFGSGWKLHFS